MRKLVALIAIMAGLAAVAGYLNRDRLEEKRQLAQARIQEKIDERTGRRKRERRKKLLALIPAGVVLCAVASFVSRNRIRGKLEERKTHSPGLSSDGDGPLQEETEAAPAAAGPY